MPAPSVRLRPGALQSQYSERHDHDFASLHKSGHSTISARGIVVYLQTTIDKQVARTQRDKRRPLLQNEDPEQVLRDLAEMRNPLYEEVADYIVDTDDQSARAVANQIISKIGL